ncbi:protein-L-isoaspartate O-methyltransferase family protein [Acidisoma sp. C75]
MMVQSALSFASARQFMVDSQLRPNRVVHAAVLEAMRRIPREIFLPPTAFSVAYADQDVSLGGGRVLMAPLAFAQLAQALDPREGERILVVGAGCGYGAAVLAACGARVTALEADAGLVAAARAGCRAAGLDVALQEGALAGGIPGAQRWDAILIEGMVDAVPPQFAAQLRLHGGRLVTVRRQAGVGGGGQPTGVAVRAEPQGESFVVRPLFDCQTAPLPGFERELEFQF